MNDVNTSSGRATSTALWRRWRPSNSFFPRLAPRLNRRRRRSSKAFSAAAASAGLLSQNNNDKTDPNEEEEEQEDVFASSTTVDDSETPSSPRQQGPSLLSPMETECSTPTSQMADNPIHDLDLISALTPPTASPAQLVVSAKRLGSEVRRNHSKRRKGRLGNGCDKENLIHNWRSEQEYDDEGDSEELPSSELQQLSPKSQAQQYWKWCYGDDNERPQVTKSWSASRAPPSKSCLSVKKQSSGPMIRAVTLESPGHHGRPQSVQPPASALVLLYATPTSSFSSHEDDQKKQRSCSSKSVQFGTTVAAEYERDDPPKELTTMRVEVAERYYPCEEKSVEQAVVKETKHNSATLAEWEDYFDSYCQDDNDLEEHLFANSNRGRKSRRTSGYFSPSTLLLPEQETTVDCSPMQQSQDDDDVIDVPMASLAVQSPDEQENATAEILMQLQQLPPVEPSPPSDFRVLESLHSTGGALVLEAAPTTTQISSRRLAGSLELCAYDNKNQAEDESADASCLLQEERLCGRP